MFGANREADMRKFMRIILALMIVLMASSVPAQADRGRHGHGGGHGGHGRVGIGVFVGPGLWWPGWWGPYPYYPYYPPPVSVEPPTDLYVQPAPQADENRYWYYCKESQGYYPTVKKCPGGWMKVVPPAPQPEGEE